MHVTLQAQISVQLKAHLTSYVNNSLKLSSHDNYRESVNHEKPQALPHDIGREMRIHILQENLSVYTYHTDLILHPSNVPTHQRYDIGAISFMRV